MMVQRCVLGSKEDVKEDIKTGAESALLLVASGSVRPYNMAVFIFFFSLLYLFSHIYIVIVRPGYNYSHT